MSDDLCLIMTWGESDGSHTYSCTIHGFLGGSEKMLSHIEANAERKTMTLPVRAEELAWCDSGPTCTADVKGREHHDCPDGCGQSTSQKGRVIRQCGTCPGRGFCVSWITRTRTWSCAKCRQRAWERMQADREPRRQEMDNMFDHERGAKQQSTVRHPRW